MMAQRHKRWSNGKQTMGRVWGLACLYSRTVECCVASIESRIVFGLDTCIELIIINSMAHVIAWIPGKLKTLDHCCFKAVPSSRRWPLQQTNLAQHNVYLMLVLSCAVSCDTVPALIQRWHNDLCFLGYLTFYDPVYTRGSGLCIQRPGYSDPHQSWSVLITSYCALIPLRMDVDNASTKPKLKRKSITDRSCQFS